MAVMYFDENIDDNVADEMLVFPLTVVEVFFVLPLLLLLLLLTVVTPPFLFGVDLNSNELFAPYPVGVGKLL